MPFLLIKLKFLDVFDLATIALALTFEMLSCDDSSVVVGLINVYSVWSKHIPSSLLFKEFCHNMCLWSKFVTLLVK